MMCELTADVQAICRRRAKASRTPQAKIRPGSPAPTIGPGTETGAKLVSLIGKWSPGPPSSPPVVSVKKLVPTGAFPKPKRLKSPQPPVKHVPQGPPGVDCPTSCVVKSNVAPLVDQRNVSIRRKSLNPNVPSPVPAPLTVSDRALMNLLTGERSPGFEFGFGRVVRSKVIRALAVAPLPKLAPDHSTSNVWKTSAFAGGKRDDALKRAISAPMAQASFDFMAVTPSMRPQPRRACARQLAATQLNL